MINISIARLKKGMKQKELAEKMNVSSNTISRWEKGSMEIKLENLIKLADILEVSIDFLVGRE